MADFGINNSANNFGRSAGLLANTTALRPVQAAEGTIFVDVETLLIYRYDAIGEAGWQQIGGGGGGGINAADNGLSVDGETVILGGALYNDTDITLEGFNLNIQGDTGTLYNFGSSGCLLYASNMNNTNATLDLQNNGSVSLIGNNSSTDLLQAAEIIINNVGIGEVEINNTFTFDNGGITDTINYSSFIANSTKTQLEHVELFYNDGEYFPITARFSIKGNPNGQNEGLYNFRIVPAYANNSAALIGGLIVGDIYRSTTGGGDTLHIVH